tara:strand:- start:14564 stop:15334 length:771 start_codon:yes stop_codon:yes gene_type:complete
MKKIKSIATMVLATGLLFIANQNLSAQDRIVLDPDSTDSFVLDPAIFDPDDKDARVLRHEPFGRKKEAVYERGERENGTPIIIASSDNSISSVTTPLTADPAVFQYLEWEWKIESVIESGDMTRKDGDDFTARVYVTFDYDKSNLGFGDRIKYAAYKAFTSFDIPLRSLNYIWANKAEIGATGENPFSSWVQYVVVQSGNELAGEWKIEKRNILEDYRMVYGEEPPPISGITIMTDSDNTGESTKAYFGKITLSKE